MPLVARKSKPSDNMLRGAKRYTAGPLAGNTVVECKPRELKAMKLAGWREIKEATPEQGDADKNDAAALEAELAKWAASVVLGTISEVEDELEGMRLSEEEADALITAERGRDPDKPEGRSGVMAAILKVVE